MSRLLWVVVFAGCATSVPSRRPVQRDTPEARSDDASALLTDALGRFSPEFLGRVGITGRDTDIVDLKPEVGARFRAAIEDVRAQLTERRAAERDALVKQDLDILLDTTAQMVRESDVEERTLLPYENLRKAVFVGVISLLDDSVPPERRAAALVRLRKYSGIEPGYEPIVSLAEARVRERLGQKELLGPVRTELEKDLSDAATYQAGIEKLVEKFGDASWKGPLATLEEQLDGYDAFLRAEVLPRSRVDFRLPTELYRIRLLRKGIDLDPAELAKRAHAAFDETKAQAQALAAEVARERGLKAADYVSVIKELKKDQVRGDALLQLFESRIKDVEAVIRRENLVTLPERPMVFRVATEAETAEQPAPHVDPRGIFSRDKDVRLQFVLPLTSGHSQLRYDDFTFAAGSWTITAHEGRPGHDLQLSKIAERGLTRARTLFAFNSTNVEGWALYAEQIMRPFMPADARLCSLQALMLREARAFLDPELQAGTLSYEQARAVLLEQVVASPALAEEELQRYTFDAPGQAPSYFYGWTRINALRVDLEKALGPKFDARVFHDTLLAQGLLPPALLEQSVKAVLVK